MKDWVLLPDCQAAQKINVHRGIDTIVQHYSSKLEAWGAVLSCCGSFPCKDCFVQAQIPLSIVARGGFRGLRESLWLSGGAYNWKAPLVKAFQVTWWLKKTSPWDSGELLPGKALNQMTARARIIFGTPTICSTSEYQFFITFVALCFFYIVCA